MKCFDQIQRPLLYDLLREAGLPDDLVDTYADMLDGLEIVQDGA